MDILKQDLKQLAGQKGLDQGLKVVLEFDAKRRYMDRHYPHNDGSRCGKCLTRSKLGDRITWHWTGYKFHQECLPTDV